MKREEEIIAKLTEMQEYYDEISVHCISNIFYEQWKALQDEWEQLTGKTFTADLLKK